MVTYGYNIFEALTRGAAKGGGHGGMAPPGGYRSIVFFFRKYVYFANVDPSKKIVGQLR